MRWLAILFVLLSGVLVVPAQAKVPAWAAAGKVPTPTFSDIHLAYMRIVVNESGFKSLADQDGILQAMLWNGGGRKAGRNRHGQGYGLDYTRLMKRMASHSKRTFPPHSKFLLKTSAERALLVKRQTRLNKWTSTLQLDCSEPEGWPKKKLDGVTSMDPWGSNYGKRCRLVVETTRAFLKGKYESFCTDEPTTWGSVPDIYRPGGPRDGGWLEIHCDRPNPKNPDEDCNQLTKAELRNSKTCAKNHFWTWLKFRSEKGRTPVVDSKVPEEETKNKKKEKRDAEGAVSTGGNEAASGRSES
jgi:hypothetical protein